MDTIIFESQLSPAQASLKGNIGVGSMIPHHFVKTIFPSLSVFMAPFVPALPLRSTVFPFFFFNHSPVMGNPDFHHPSLGCTHYSNRTDARNRSLRMRYLITELQ